MNSSAWHKSSRREWLEQARETEKGLTFSGLHLSCGFSKAMFSNATHESRSETVSGRAVKNTLTVATVLFLNSLLTIGMERAKATC